MTRLLLHPLMFKLIEKYTYRALKEGNDVGIHVDPRGRVVVNIERKDGREVPSLTVPTRYLPRKGVYGG